jgi:hypothetical protein
MRFKFNGDTYLIEFQREHKQVRSGYDHEKGVEIFVPSKYPYTTVIVWKDKADAVPGELFRTATVGAYHQEPNIKHEEGRLRVLRLVTKSISDKGFKKAMWLAYVNRGKKNA